MIDRTIRSSLIFASLLLLPGLGAASPLPAESPVIERVTTVVPFPRGLAVVDGDMYVLARGRVRGAGGVTAEIEDQAGTIFRIDPQVSEPLGGEGPGPAVRANGEILARPSDPPFLLWDRLANPPEADTRTDRPYCTLRFHEPTRSFYLCAFSGVDLRPQLATDEAFSKNPTDGLLRYDLRTNQWYEIERHRADTWKYPHHDPATNPPPHGLLKGPDNCLPLGNWLYAVAKDNSVLVRYDLSALANNPEAGHPPAQVIMGEEVELRGLGLQRLRGQSGLAYRDGWLYVSYRTTSEIIRLRLDDEYDPVQPIEAELVARFDPWNPQTGASPDLTDIGFDDDGRLYVLSAQPARVFRFRPDPNNVFDARDDAREPWVHLARETANPRMKSENILVHDGWLYVTSGDGYSYQAGASGTVYRVRIDG